MYLNIYVYHLYRMREAIEMIIVKITLELVDMSNKELKQNTKRVTEMQKTLFHLQ